MPLLMLFVFAMLVGINNAVLQINFGHDAGRYAIPTTCFEIFLITLIWCAYEILRKNKEEN